MSFENLDEKYKPISIKDIVGQDHVTRRAQGYVKNGNMPHLMLAGPPGTGKTSLVHALAHEFYGEHWSKNLHIFNASKNRGIEFVRKDIADLTMIEPVGAPFQIIFLDECDSLTNDAQGALREIMQAHTSTTKFILGCNYINKIIDPIQDRCRIFRFKRLPPEDIEKKLVEIALIEKINFEPTSISWIAENSNGSLRTAINHLSTYQQESDIITLETVKLDMPKVATNDSKTILDAALRGDIKTYEEHLFLLYYDNGFASEEILDSILSLIDTYNFTSIQRKNLIHLIGEYNWRISQGSNELLQMRCFLRTLETI